MPTDPTETAVTNATHSVDAFHRGRFHLVQPRGGHRSGLDALLLAAAVPSGFAGHAADLGAGAGAAGLAVLSRCPEAHLTLVERDPVMLDCARLTLALTENQHLASRAKILDADVGLTGPARIAAGLADAQFDVALMNPPFNDPSDRVTPDALRKAAHVMDDGLFEAWIRTAAAIVRPGGTLALIARPESLGDILTALGRRFGGPEIILVYPRPDQPAIRLILRATKGSKARPTFLPPLVLRDASGSQPTDRAQRLSDGLAALYSD